MKAACQGRLHRAALCAGSVDHYMSEQDDPDTPPAVDPVLFSAQPEPVSFLHRYLLCFVPVVLVILTIAVTMILKILVEAGTHMASSATSSIPVSSLAAVDNTGLTQTLTSGMGDVPAISILMIAPVGIFVIVAAVGWTLRITELWTGPALTLGLSVLGAGVMTLAFGTHTQNMFLYFLRWVAFLIQPFAILAGIVVFLWLDRFRKSIHYTITERGISIRGGVGTMMEHQLPMVRIGSVVLERDFLGKRYGYGTVIPVSTTRWGTETSLRGIGAGGQKDSLGGGIMFAKSREESSRSPLDCLYGIPNADVAQQIIMERIARPSIRLEEQTEYLRKMCEMQESARGG